VLHPRFTRGAPNITHMISLHVQQASTIRPIVVTFHAFLAMSISKTKRSATFVAKPVGTPLVSRSVSTSSLPCAPISSRACYGCGVCGPALGPLLYARLCALGALCTEGKQAATHSMIGLLGQSNKGTTCQGRLSDPGRAYPQGTKWASLSRLPANRNAP
jgi:hypothetical protein